MVVVAGLLTFALVAFVNLAAYHYGRGALRAAADQAARAGSRASASAATCQQRGREALDSLLGGSLGQDATLTCADDGEHVRATATGRFRGWVEAVPDRTFTVTATVRKEQGP